MLAGLAAFLGHLFPVWLKFRGGKGVATFLGVTLALAWPAGLAACATWLATAFATRFSSLAALVAAAATPLWLVRSADPTPPGSARARGPRFHPPPSQHPPPARRQRTEGSGRKAQ